MDAWLIASRKINSALAKIRFTSIASRCILCELHFVASATRTCLDNMKRFSINEVTTFHWSFEEDVARYRTYGFGGIGLWRHKLSDYCEQAIAGHLRHQGLQVSSLQWAGGFTGSEGLSFDEAVDDAESAIRLGSIVNTGCVIIHPGATNGHTRNHAYRLLATALEQLVPVAHDFGVRLALEPMQPGWAQTFTYLDSIELALAFCRGYPADELGIVFDLFHFGASQQAKAVLAENFDRVALVQLADQSLGDGGLTGDRCLPGSGSLQLADWNHFFESRGYHGLYEVELFGTEFYDVNPFETLDRLVQDMPRQFGVDLKPSVHGMWGLARKTPEGFSDS